MRLLAGYWLYPKLTSCCYISHLLSKESTMRRAIVILFSCHSDSYARYRFLPVSPYWDDVMLAASICLLCNAAALHSWAELVCAYLLSSDIRVCSANGLSWLTLFWSPFLPHRNLWTLYVQSLTSRPVTDRLTDRPSTIHEFKLIFNNNNNQ